LLIETQMNEEQKEFVNIIKRSSNNLLVIINDVLDFSKIKAGKLTIESIDFNLSDIIENNWASFKHRFSKKHIDFQVDVDPAIPTWLKGDPHRLSQILVNLIGNAIKFTDKGGVRLSINLAGHQDGKALLEFNVTDSGIGISPAHINNIFESFTQASDDTSRKFGGTGLGLAICKQLVHLQHGHIKVSSTMGVGTTFTFQLPYTAVEKSNEPPVVLNYSEKYFEHELTGKRFLVAEDNVINQKVIFHNLKKAGIITDIANNGREAVEKLQAGNRYDLIIMDLQMPEMDGYQTTTHIRKVLKLEMPIIAMTATILKGESDRCMEVGMNDYLSKPFMPADLFRSIRSLLNKQLVEKAPEVTVKEDERELFNLSSLEELEDEEYLLEILEMFLSDTPVYMDEMTQAAALQNWDEVHRQAHKIKSGVGLIQSAGLLEMLSSIESSAKKDTAKADLYIVKAMEQYTLVAESLTIKKDSLRSSLTMNSLLKTA
jgi:CheY-like chemotaxis protein/two-component sensor histidine kinase